MVGREMSHACFTFESFARSQASASALRLCRAIAGSAPSAPRVVLLHGPTGVGKSHLLRASAALFAARNPAARVVMTTATDLARGLTDAIRADRLNEFRHTLADASIVILDDVHALVDKPATQYTISRLLADAVANGARVIGAATAAPGTFAALYAELRGRTVVRQCAVKRPGARDMRSIVRAIATDRFVAMSASSVNRVAHQSRGDVRRAVGAIAHIQALRSLSAAHADPPWMEETAIHAG